MTDKDLCMEWYLKHGERASNLLCGTGPKLHGLHLVEWINPSNQECYLGKLTPKALELIRS